jgi:copper(I)-binding protein
MKPSNLVRVAIAAFILLVAAGCSSATGPASSDNGSVQIVDAWVKTQDTGMTAAFGTVTNTSSRDVTVTSVETPVSPMVQLHETVASAAGDMVMQEKAGGFTIPAGGSLSLAPGGNHIMLMGLAHPLQAGDDVDFTVSLSDGTSFTFTAAVKDFAGANENYVEETPSKTSGMDPDMTGTDMPGMDPSK